VTITLNLSGVEASTGGAVLGVGKHRATFTESVEGESSGAHPQFEVKLSNDEGSIRDWVVITDKSLWKVRQMIEAVGHEIPDGEFKFQASWLVGCEVGITVAIEKYKDEDKTRVKYYDRLPETKAKKISSGHASTGVDDDDSIPFRWIDDGVLDII